MSGKIRKTSGRGRLFDSVLDTIGDTPVIRINNLAPDNVTIYVKAEAFNPGASVKDRLAVNIIEAAEREGKLKPKNVSPDLPAPLSGEVESRLRTARAKEFALYDRLMAADGYLQTPQE